MCKWIREGKGTGTAILEVKLSATLCSSENGDSVPGFPGYQEGI